MMAQDSILRVLLCPGCKCLCAQERLYVCLRGHTICARCVRKGVERTAVNSPSASCCCCCCTCPRVSVSQSNPFDVAVGTDVNMMHPFAKSGTDIAYQQQQQQRHSEVADLEASGAGRGDAKTPDLGFTSGTEEGDQMTSQFPGDMQLQESACPCCGSRMTGIRNLIAEELSLLVAKLGGCRLLPLECQRPAPAPTTLPLPRRPSDPTTSLPGIVKSMLPAPSSIDSSSLPPTASYQRRYRCVPKLDLNGRPSSLISEGNGILDPPPSTQLQPPPPPNNSEITQSQSSLPKKNYSPIRCPLSECGRTVAPGGFVHHFSFEHADVPMRELRAGERMRASVAPAALPVGMARVAVLYLLANQHNVAYNTLVPRKLSRFKHHLPVCLLLARIAAGAGTWQDDALLVWLAGLDFDSAPVSATLSAHASSAMAPRLAQDTPLDSLRDAHDPRSVAERGHAVLIHAGLLRQLMRDSSTFELSLLV